MKTAHRAFKGAAYLAVGQCLSYGCSLLRNILLARLLTKADFGLAVAFGTTVALLELATKMDAGAQVVQSRSPKLDSLQDTLQTALFGMGVFSSLLFLALSIPMAKAFGVPQHAAWFALLGLIPLFKGLEHLDCQRQVRELNYLPVLVSDVVPQIIITAAAWPLARHMGSFQVILVLMVAKSAMSLVLTHVMARRRFRMSPSKEFARAILQFSGPLLLNSLLMYTAQQADQMVVGSCLSVETLATYATAFSVMALPWFITSQVGSALMEPILSRHQDSPASFLRHYRTALRLSTFCALVLAGAVILAGDWGIRLLYGARYGDTAPILAVLGVTASVRYLRLAAAMAAFAKGDTASQLFANCVRALSLPLMLLIVYFEGGLLWVLSAGSIAEIAATVFSLRRLQARHGIPFAVNLPDMGLLVGGLVLVLIAGQFTRNAGAGINLLALTLLWSAGALVFPRLLPEVHAELGKWLRAKFGLGSAA